MRPLLTACFLALPSLALAQGKFDPPKTHPPDAAQIQSIRDRQRQLAERLRAMQADPKLNSRLPSVEIYLRASERIVEHQEFWHVDAARWTLAILDAGLSRATEASEVAPAWWKPSTRSTARAYRSRIDDSVQPYAVTYPADYGTVPGKRYRLDLVLHGRDASLTEVRFLNTHNGTREAPKGRDYIQIELYGRGNNAYRWAGERDVFEALEHFHQTEKEAGRGEHLDANRVVLRGFSMGGAGTWHLGLHHPDRFCVLGPGAGFSTTHGYIKNLPDPLPEPQEATLRIYDAVRYAENAEGLPVVAYSGEKDPQRAAADLIEACLKELKITTMKHLIAPGLEHQMPAEWQKKAEQEFAPIAGVGRNPSPDRIAFTTYTLRYPRRDWLEIRGLSQHYQKAKITAERSQGAVTIRTLGIESFAIRETEATALKSITIDGQAVARTTERYFLRQQGTWKSAASESAQLQKRPGLQGPIDDAFMDRFVCVPPAGEATPSGVTGHLQDSLQQFARTWAKHLRGSLPQKPASEVPLDTAEAHLVLWGEPGSNPHLRQVTRKLGIAWDEKSLEWDGVRYDARTHYLRLIAPNPFRPDRYVVLNSGHTFGEEEFKGTNALLYPRHGDWAVMKLTPGADGKPRAEVVRSGLFDERWTLPTGRAK